MGAIDHRNADAIAQVLVAELNSNGAGLGDALDSHRDLHVDLSGLEFVDVAGIRRIVRVAESAPAAVRLVLHGMPPAILRVMTVVGWADHPKLVMDKTVP